MKKSALILLCFVCFFLIACTHNGDKSQNSLNVHNGAEPPFIDPGLCFEVTCSHIAINLFEGLVTLDSKTHDIIPAIATKWAVSDNKKEYTFYLRQDAKWSDGKPVTANDFYYAIKRNLSPALASQSAYLLYHIQNAKLYNEGKILDFNQVGVKVGDDYTLVITLNEPVAYFTKLLMLPIYFPLRKDVADQSVSNGPFVMTEWKLNDVIRTKKNPFYYGKDKIKIDGVNFYHVEMDKTAEAMYRAGKLHAIYQLPIGEDSLWRGKPDYVVEKLYGTYYYSLNTTHPPLNNVKVRQALILSLDRDKLTKHVVQSETIPLNSFVPDDSHYHPPAVYMYDVSKAKKLLAEAGYPDGKNFRKVTLKYNTKENHRKIAEAVQEMWKENLNIHVALENEEGNVFINTRVLGDFDMARNGWIADYLDPYSFLELAVTGATHNYSKWSSKSYDQLIEKSKIEIDDDVRYKLYADAEKILLKDAPVIPIYVNTMVRLVNPKVKNFPNNPLYYHVYKDVGFF